MPNDIYHFPSEITLLKYPLVEAWLEIQWEPVRAEGAESQADASNFLLSLALFYQQISTEFSSSEALPAAQLPLEVGRLVRNRFRQSPGSWPLIQIGPGIASLNYSPDGYTWSEFRRRALFLREKLLIAFANPPIKFTCIALRYRNTTDFSHSLNSVTEFMKEFLNFSIVLPQHFPGEKIANPLPVHQKAQVGYRLQVPPALGTLSIATGFAEEEEGKREVVVWQFDIVSDEDLLGDIDDLQSYEQWLDMAHATVHEWFFALIDGPLREKYEKA